MMKIKLNKYCKYKYSKKICGYERANLEGYTIFQSKTSIFTYFNIHKLFLLNKSIGNIHLMREVAKTMGGSDKKSCNFYFIYIL